MTVIVFLIDNSASMCQRTYIGTSLLDIAKGAVESFCKIRSKSSRSDRYYIFSLDKEPNELKSTEPKQNPLLIRAALDGIKPNGYTSLGVGIRRTFDMLNLIRMSNGLENYGMGRYPSQIEHAIVVCITDGQSLTSDGAVSKGELTLPVLNNNVQGYEYTVEPFRWDYKFYSLVLRIPGFLNPVLKSIEQATKFIQTDETCPIRSMCEVTGGRAYKITNERSLHQCLESLSQKCSPGVVLHFMKLDEANDNGKTGEIQAWHNCKKMIYVKSSSVGTANSHWPIPESFWPDEHINDKLPARSAHPIICFSTQKMPGPRMMEHFPVDRYELEPSPLTQYMLERHDSNFVWHCYVPKSGKQQDYPFGYLKPSTELQSVYLYVLCYNFPALIELLSSLSDTFKMRVNDAWGGKFAHYLGIIPKYYFSPLSRAFEKIGLPHLIKQDSIERILPFSLKASLQKMRQQAKLLLEMEQKAAPIPYTATLIKSTNRNKHRKFIDGNNNTNTNLLITSQVKMQPVYNRVPRTDISSYFQPRNIPHTQMRSMVRKSIKNIHLYLKHYQNEMCNPTNNLSQSLIKVLPMNTESIHEQPMSQMGDYNNYRFNKLPEPLRELNPPPERKETFGNPFRRKSPQQPMLMYINSNLSNNSNTNSNPLSPNNHNISGNSTPTNSTSSGASSGSFEADEKFVEDMLTSPGLGGNLRRSPVSQEYGGRNKGRLPLNITYYNWRRTPANSSTQSTPCPSPMRDYDDDYSQSCDEIVMCVDVTSSDSFTSDLPNGSSTPPDSPLLPTSSASHYYEFIATHKASYQHNRELLKELITILRHPKIDGSQVFELLVNFKGPYKLQKVMIGRCLHKSRQFKRYRISQLIQQYLLLLSKEHDNNNDDEDAMPQLLVNGH